MALVGASGVGKTTLMLRLIAEFVHRGMAITVVKRTHHSLLDCQERAGSDSELYRKSAANQVGLVARDGERWWPDVATDPKSILLVEGGKRSSFPKIELLDPVRGFHEPLVDPRELIAVLGSSPLRHLPCLDPENPAQWVDFLLDYWSGPKLSR